MSVSSLSVFREGGVSIFTTIFRDGYQWIKIWKEVEFDEAKLRKKYSDDCIDNW